jgi:hypothetical protein
MSGTSTTESRSKKVGIVLDIRSYCQGPLLWGPSRPQLLSSGHSAGGGSWRKIDLYHALIILASGGGGQRLISAATIGLFGMSDGLLYLGVVTMTLSCP